MKQHNILKKYLKDKAKWEFKKIGIQAMITQNFRQWRNNLRRVL